MPVSPMDPTSPPNWSVVADFVRTILLLGIPVLMKWASDIRRDVREQSERLKGVETWSEEHEKRDDERFHDLRSLLHDRRSLR